MERNTLEAEVAAGLHNGLLRVCVARHAREFPGDLDDLWQEARLAAVLAARSLPEGAPWGPWAQTTITRRLRHYARRERAGGLAGQPKFGERVAPLGGGVLAPLLADEPERDPVLARVLERELGPDESRVVSLLAEGHDARAVGRRMGRGHTYAGKVRARVAARLASRGVP